MNQEVKKINGYNIKDEQARNNIESLNLTRIKTFNNIQSMKNDTTLLEGMHVKTKGYYDIDDGGNAEYIIVDDETLLNDGGLIHVLNNGLRAKLIFNEYIYPEQFGAYGDNTHDDTTILQNLIDSDYKIMGNKNYLITEPLTIGSEKNVQFNGNITYSGNDSAIKIDGRLIKCKFNKVIANNGISLNIGSTAFTQGFDITFKTLSGNIPIKLGGNDTGTLDGNITGQFINFTTNAIKVDLSNTYVGQINFYNMRIESNQATTNYAVDIDCANTSCTGLSFNNVSFEGNMNGLHAYNMTSEYALQTLYMNNIRCAELSYKYSKKVLCFESTGEGNSAPVKGYINFDTVTTSAFDFENYRPNSLCTFKGYGTISVSDYVYWKEFYTGYKMMLLKNINRIQTTTWTPENNEICSKLMVVDKDGARTNYHSNYKSMDTFYLYFTVNGSFTIRAGDDSASYLTISGHTGELYLIHIFPNTTGDGGSILNSLISNSATLSTYSIVQEGI